MNHLAVKQVFRTPGVGQPYERIREGNPKQVPGIQNSIEPFQFSLVKLTHRDNMQGMSLHPIVRLIYVFDNNCQGMALND